ncbi:hypothetical protein [Candidatus Corynebacterium faecigallinarum]|uniref:hypothetical protein n=1 Tax=Candidatus Corynebacterium faecigallinarum TaxID=2838528 RepID=UPI003FD4757F
MRTLSRFPRSLSTRAAALTAAALIPASAVACSADPEPAPITNTAEPRGGVDLNDNADAVMSEFEDQRQALGLPDEASPSFIAITPGIVLTGIDPGPTQRAYLPPADYNGEAAQWAALRAHGVVPDIAPSTNGEVQVLTFCAPGTSMRNDDAEVVRSTFGERAVDMPDGRGVGVLIPASADQVIEGLTNSLPCE